jgi:hypothetical protein
MNDFTIKPDEAEPFITIKDAAARLGLPYFKLQRFVKSGGVTRYKVANSRQLVRLSELIAAIESSRSGGAHD